MCLPPGVLPKEQGQLLHRENAGVCHCASDNPNDGFSVNASELGGVLPLPLAVLEAGCNVGIEAPHGAIVGHVCPAVKAVMPQRSSYPMGMPKAKMRGVVESIIGANLDALMAHSLEFNTTHRIGAKAKIPARTVGRIKNAEVSCSVDTLAKIAKVFGIEPWAMLVPNYDPRNPPVRTMTQEERDFYARTKKAFENLPPDLAETVPPINKRPARTRRVRDPETTGD